MFTGFLDNDDLYYKVESYWEKKCLALMQNCKNKENWKTWLKTSYVNGQPFLDGNPIYSLINFNVKRAIKVIQVEEEGNLLDFWLEDYESQIGKIDVLTVYCVLNDETDKKINDILLVWFRDGAEELKRGFLEV